MLSPLNKLFLGVQTVLARRKAQLARLMTVRTAMINENLVDFVDLSSPDRDDEGEILSSFKKIHSMAEKRQEV